MKQAKVFISNTYAGILTEDEAGYEFKYLPEYLASDSAVPVSPTLPLSHKPDKDKVPFPFFDGLIP